MAAIKSDFPSLAGDDSETMTADFARVLSELKGRKWPIPVTPAKGLTRAVLLAHLQGIAGTIIAAELKADEARPAKASAAHPIPRLYVYQAEADEAGKVPPPVALTDEEIAVTFNNFRAGRLFVGLPHAPNAITAEDIAAAKKG